MFEKKWTAGRISEFRKLWNSGAAAIDIAERFGINPRTVEKYARYKRDFGCEWPQPKPASPINISAISRHPVVKSRSILDIPRSLLGPYIVRLYMFASLVWDYVDTVLETAALMRVSSTKALSRSVRDLRKSYEQMRSSNLDDAHVKCEYQLALYFEEICRNHLAKLTNGIKADKDIGALAKDWKMLVIAVMQAVTLLDALFLYAEDVDAFIQSYGVMGKSALTSHFKSLKILLPQFAGDAYKPDIWACSLTSKILRNELRALEICEDNQQAVER